VFSSCDAYNHTRLNLRCAVVLLDALIGRDSFLLLPPSLGVQKPGMRDTLGENS